MRLVIVSNRLPITLENDLAIQSEKRSIGGLVTGLEAYIAQVNHHKIPFSEVLWVGWPGCDVNKNRQRDIETLYTEKYRCAPVFLEPRDIDDHYYGYCNKTLWPLFHYFTALTEYNPQYWEAYQNVNESFLDNLKMHLREDDFVWVHDYHLMLLPALLRREFPKAIISFFLHIPFPTHDIFRHIPKPERVALLEGLLGANLIAFHTSDYMQSFMQSIEKELRLQMDSQGLQREYHKVMTGTFPMGVDYEAIRALSMSDKCIEIVKKIRATFRGRKIILSIDRLDYTKGILNRLSAFEKLLQSHPELRDHVILMLVVAPSRREIEAYQEMKSHIDEVVGRINGKYGSHDWMPVVYQYRQYDHEDLCALYASSDIALITPLRDGLNLIAKEFIAANTNYKGVLILSEFAGASKELTDAILVNPNSVEEIINAFLTALNMGEEEIQDRNQKMHNRVTEYTIHKWAQDIVDLTIKCVSTEHSEAKVSKTLDELYKKRILKEYTQSKSSILFLDYDGTLAPFTTSSELAKPSIKLLDLLKSISINNNTEVVIITGRNRMTIQEWFYGINLSFSTDYGAWINQNGEWFMSQAFNCDWKKPLRSMISKYAERLPNSFIEEKECALVWDYRIAEIELRKIRSAELINELNLKINEYADIDVLRGDYNLIIRSRGSTKGDAVKHWLDNRNYDFILAIGDDDADEELFSALPEKAHTLKIGYGNTNARYFLSKQEDVQSFLELFTTNS